MFHGTLLIHYPQVLVMSHILCIYSHENDNGCTAYLRLSNGAIAEIRLKETE